MRASSSSRAVAFSRQQSQRTTRRTPSVVSDFQPVSSQIAQAIGRSNCSTDTRRRPRSTKIMKTTKITTANSFRDFVALVILVFFVPLPRARLSRVSWFVDRDLWSRANEIGRRRFHERGREPLLPVAEAAGELVLDVLHELVD